MGPAVVTATLLHEGPIGKRSSHHGSIARRAGPSGSLRAPPGAGSEQGGASDGIRTHDPRNHNPVL